MNCLRQRDELLAVSAALWQQSIRLWLVQGFFVFLTLFRSQTSTSVNHLKLFWCHCLVFKWSFLNTIWIRKANDKSVGSLKHRLGWCLFCGCFWCFLSDTICGYWVIWVIPSQKKKREGEQEHNEWDSALYVAIFICLIAKASTPISRTSKWLISPEFKKPISDLNCSHCVVFVFPYALTQWGADSHSSLNTDLSFL